MRFTFRRSDMILLSIVVLSMLTKLTFIFLAGKHSAPQLYEYEGVASHALAGDGFVTEYAGTRYHTIGHPLYPMLCIILYYFTHHSFLAVLIVQILLASLLPVLIYQIGKRIADRSSGLLAAFLVALHPGVFIYSTSKLHPLTVDAFIFSLVVLLFLILREKPSLKLSVVTGCILGICLLSRSTIFIFFLWAAAWFFYHVEIKPRKAMVLILSIFACAFLTILPWAIRNYNIYHRPVVILNNFGLNFWIGNNPNATGSALTQQGEPVLHAMQTQDLHKFYEMDEIQQGDFLTRKAFKFVQENPRRFLILYAKKLFYFWWFSPQSGREYDRIWLYLYQLYYSGIVVFFLLGAYRAFFVKKNAGNLLIFFLFFILSATQALFFVEGRHRWAIEPLMMVYVAMAVVTITRKLLVVAQSNCKNYHEYAV